MNEWALALWAMTATHHRWPMPRAAVSVAAPSLPLCRVGTARFRKQEHGNCGSMSRRVLSIGYRRRSAPSGQVTGEPGT